jgi:hypothetical protein
MVIDSLEPFRGVLEPGGVRQPHPTIFGFDHYFLDDESQSLFFD